MPSFQACMYFFLFMCLFSTIYYHHILHCFILYELALAVQSWEHTNRCTEKGTDLCLYLCRALQRLQFIAAAMGFQRKKHNFFLFWTCTGKNIFLHTSILQNFKAAKSNALFEASIICVICILYIVI